METGAARDFRVLRDVEAWRLELRLGTKWLPVRYWRSLTAVGRFCEGQGIKTLTVSSNPTYPVHSKLKRRHRVIE